MKSHSKTKKKYAKKGTHIKSMQKTCRTKMYQSIFGAASGGSIRSERQLYY